MLNGYYAKFTKRLTMKKLFLLLLITVVCSLSISAQNSFDYPFKLQNIKKAEKQSVILRSFDVSWQGNRLYLMAKIDNVTKKTLNNIFAGLMCRDGANNPISGSLDRLEVSGFGLAKNTTGTSWIKLGEAQSYNAYSCEVSVYTETKGDLFLEASSLLQVPNF